MGGLRFREWSIRGVVCLLAHLLVCWLVGRLCMAQIWVLAVGDGVDGVVGGGVIWGNCWDLLRF